VHDFMCQSREEERMIRREIIGVLEERIKEI
jgi:hypothetical protein